MSPSELAHIFIDGEPIDPRAEGTLFDALAASSEFRAELRDLLAVRAAVQSDVDALMPSKEVTDRLFASLGIAPLGSASASVPVSGRSWLRRLWLPLLAAVVGSAITAVVVTNNRSHDVQSLGNPTSPSISQQSPSNQSLSTATQTGGASSTSVTPVTPVTPPPPSHSKHGARDRNVNAAGIESADYKAYKARVESALAAIPNQSMQSTTSNTAKAADAKSESVETPIVAPSPTLERRAPIAVQGSIESQRIAPSDAVERPAPVVSSGATTTPGSSSAKIGEQQPVAISQQSVAQSSATASAPVVAAPHDPSNVATTSAAPVASVTHDSAVANQTRVAPAESIHGGPISSGLPGASAPVLPPDYAAIVRGLISRSVPASSIATSTGGLPSNVSAGVFRMFSAHHQAGIEIGQESFGQQFSRQEADSFVVYKQNPTLFWGTAAYRVIASPVSMLGGMMPYAQTNLGASRIGPLARITLGFMFDIADKLNLIFGGEGAMMWYRFESAWLSTRKIGATFGAAFQILMRMLRFMLAGGAAIVVGAVVSCTNPLDVSTPRDRTATNTHFGLTENLRLPPVYTAITVKESDITGPPGWVYRTPTGIKVGIDTTFRPPWVWIDGRLVYDSNATSSRSTFQEFVFALDSMHAVDSFLTTGTDVKVWTRRRIAATVRWDTLYSSDFTGRNWLKWDSVNHVLVDSLILGVADGVNGSATVSGMVLMKIPY